MYYWVALGAFASFLAWLLYTLFFYSALWTKWGEEVPGDSSVKGISIIIAARNEVDHLKQHVDEWLKQRGVPFEIIIVDDRSWDGTEELIDEMAALNPKIQVCHVKENSNYQYSKKFAITLAIKKAKYDHFLLSDADCFPQSYDVLQQVYRAFCNGKNLVIGYSPVIQQKGFLSWLQSAENLSTAITYFSFAKRGLAYMGVGRFLGYSRWLYDRVGGFKGHYFIPFGDDDLFVQSSVKYAKVALVHPDFRVNTMPKKELWEWWNMRKRHFSASKAYRLKYKTLLSLPYILNLCFYFFAALAIADGRHLLFMLTLLLSRLAIGVLVGYLNGKKFGKSLEGSFLPFWEIIIFIIHPFIYLAGALKPVSRW